MKIYFLPIFFCFGLFLKVQAQIPNDSKRDYTWILGKGTWAGNLYGGCGINFNNNPATTFTCYQQIDQSWDNGAICDTNGNILFHCNGMEVADRVGNKMPHGDSLNFGDAYVNYHHTGYPVSYGVLILPLPGSSNVYFIIHVKVDCNAIGLVLFCSIVDLNENSGFGDVIERNIPILTDSLSGGYLTACRHGNGRDWWILVPKLGEASYYRLLLDPEGIHIDGKQFIGNPNSSRRAQWGNAAFSPDGLKYVRCADTFVSNHQLINVFSFDRCTGLLSDFIDLSFCHSDLVLGTGVAISQNSKFLYFNTDSTLYQYDLSSPDIINSQQVIDVWNGFLYLGIFATGFAFGQLAPDGKIYNPAINTKCVHVIEYPDSLGSSCNFIQQAFQMPKIVCYPPNYPNFRLGRWIGSPCDNLVGIGNEEYSGSKSIVVTPIPNPASDNIRFELDIMNNKDPLELDILNLDAQIVASTRVGPFQGIVNLDVSSFDPGVYFTLLKNNDQILGRCKFAVVR